MLRREERRRDKWFFCCKIIRFRCELLCNRDPLVSGHKSRGSWPVSLSSWSIFTTEEVSALTLLARNKTLTGPGGEEGGGSQGNMFMAPRSWQGPGAEVDLLAHAPRNWWLGSTQREREDIGSWTLPLDRWKIQILTRQRWHSYFQVWLRSKLSVSRSFTVIVQLLFTKNIANVDFYVQLSTI